MTGLTIESISQLSLNFATSGRLCSQSEPSLAFVCDPVPLYSCLKFGYCSDSTACDYHHCRFYLPKDLKAVRMTSPPFHGSCLCGKIAFEVDAVPLAYANKTSGDDLNCRVALCHCKNSKKYTGSVFTTNVTSSSLLGASKSPKEKSLCRHTRTMRKIQESQSQGISARSVERRCSTPMETLERLVRSSTALLQA